VFLNSAYGWERMRGCVYRYLTWGVRTPTSMSENPGFLEILNVYIISSLITQSVYFKNLANDDHYKI
jgi:hypothetical protein